jgi:hypothetical protein
LESKVLTLQKEKGMLKKGSSMLTKYKELRKDLSNNEDALEIKKSGPGILS